jgi:hypothetical protein
MFFAITIYMGVVRLPSMEAYWNHGAVLPNHFFTQHMSFYRYSMMWRCLALVEPEGEEEDGGDEEEGFLNADEDIDDLQDEVDTRWFAKVGPLFDHVRKVCKDLITPGSLVSIDEMMVRFFGRSANTFRIKNKPISEWV